MSYSEILAGEGLSSAGAMLGERLAFAGTLAQTARLVTLVSPLPEAALVVEHMSGREAVSEGFDFRVCCLSPSAHLELKQLIGEELSLRVLLADGRSTRSWNGIVTAVSALGGDGALARYELRLQAWTAWLGLRRNSRIFQGMNAEDIVRSLLADYPQASWESRLTVQLPVHEMRVQYRETDLDFLARVLAEDGLSFCFEHQQDGDGGAAYAHTRHKLVILDAGTDPAVCASPAIRFHRNSATEASDTIQRVHLERRVASTSHVRASWDYRQLLAPAGAGQTTRSDSVPELEDFDMLSAMQSTDPERSARSARLRSQYAELGSVAFRVEGSVRQLEAGTDFQLLQHAALQGDAANLRVLMVEHEASNNLRAGAGRAGLDGSVLQAERGIYRNRAVCVPAALPLVPPPRKWPDAPGLQTALVVGPEGLGSATASERVGRVRIQFHWQRGAQPNPGGLLQDGERATGDLSNGIWVRVAESLAGPNWGSSFTPRVGSEVLVDFDMGDLDHPVIVGALYNGQDEPPWPAGENSAANHTGVVAGLHAPTLDGAAWSQWQVDDSTGQLRTRLATSTHASQLNLGYLIQHAPTGSRRGAWRGDGFELRTDGWQIQRSAKGMLLSTTARQQGTSTQLDSAEAAAQLKAAADTAQRLSDAASQSEADPLAQAARIDAFRNCIHPEDTPPDGTGEPDRMVKSFAAAAMLVEAPSSIVLATPASSTLFAGEQIAVTAQDDAHLAAQHTASLVSGDATSFYTHAGGIKAIAANAPLSIQAHDGPLEVLADQNVTVTSSNDEIHVLANERIVLQAGQSSITLEGANITFACPGKFEIKSTQKVLMGGGAATASLAALPVAHFDTVQVEDAPPSLFEQELVVKTEVTEISLDTGLDFGSANDGSGQSSRLAMRFGKPYTFSVRQYENGAPATLGSIKWKICYESPVFSKSAYIEKQLPVTGDKVTVTIDDKDMCGCDITVVAWIEDPEGGGESEQFVHNRFFWFDSAKCANQIAKRKLEPWRIDQGRSSLCGMAALFYVMAKVRPDDYEKLATELHRTGEYEIGQYTIRPSASVAENMYSVKPGSAEFDARQMPDIDWLVLATTRSGESYFGYEGVESGALDMAKAVNWPRMVERLLKEIAGFSETDSFNLFEAGFAIKKSPLGKLHDWLSDSDLEDLLEIDRKYREGKQVLMVVDLDIIGGEASYATGEVFTELHWIVYEGGLKIEDDSGNHATAASEIRRIYFNAYTWGTDPVSANSFDFRSEVGVTNSAVKSLISYGVSSKSWKSNYYGYVYAM